MKKNIIRSSIFSILEIVVATLIALAMTPYLIKNLGTENYGLWLLILSTLGWFNFVELGFPTAVKREIAFALEKYDSERINTVFSVSIVLFTALGLFVVLLLLVLAENPQLIGIAEEQKMLASISLAILSFKVLLDFIMNSFYGFFSAYLRMDIDANISLANTIVKATLIYFLIVDWNVYGAVAATIIADLVSHSSKIYFAKKLQEDLKFSFKLVTFVEVKKLYAYSKHVIATGIAKTINVKSDPIIISHILGINFVAFYGVVNTLASQVESLVKAVTSVLGAFITKAVAQNRNIEASYKSTVSINLFVVIFLFTPLAILSEDFIYLWIGEEFSKYANLVFLICIAFICHAFSRPIASLLLAQAKHQYLAPANLVGALMNIGLSIILAQYLGLWGIVCATAISHLFSHVFLHAYLLKTHTNMEVRKDLVKFGLHIIGFITIVHSCRFYLRNISPLSWLELGLSAIGICILLALILWFSALNQEIRTSCLKFFQK